MSDASRLTTADPHIVLDLRGDVSGMVAVGDHIYQQQTNVTDGGIAYVLEEGIEPFAKVKRPVRLLPRADPPLLDRTDETAEVLAAVRPGGTVHITGEPGVGKSLFLTHLAHREMPTTIEDGVVHLRAKGQAIDDLGFRLFYAFHDSRLPTAFVPPPPQIRRELAGITATIIIDDADAPGVDGLLDLAVDSALILSSRRGIADGTTQIALGDLPMPEAIDLFARALGGGLDDRGGARELCEVLKGHAQCVVFAARVVQLEAVDPAALASELSGPDPCRELARRLLTALPEPEARVAEFLAALEGAPVPDARVGSATQVPDAEQALRRLSTAGIAPSNSPRYAFNTMLLEAAQDIWDLDDLRETAVEELTGWLDERPDQDSVVEAVPMALRLMEWTVASGRHHETVALAEGIDAPLVLSGFWGSWEHALEMALESARAADDETAKGWALHQLGTKALCWNEPSMAGSLLRQALDIRETLGVQSAIDATRHNIEVLNLPPGGVPPDPGPTPNGGGLSPLVKGLGAGIAAGAIAIGGYFIVQTLNTGEGILTADPAAIEYSTVLGEPTEPRDIVIGNEGDESVQIEDIAIVGEGFALIGGNCGQGIELDPGAACLLTVAFDPPLRGTYEGALNIFDANGAVSIPLMGEAITLGTVEVDPTRVEFLEVEAGTTAIHNLELRNEGDTPIVLRSFEFENGTGYGIGTEDCLPELDAGATCRFELRFTPSVEGDYPDLLLIPHSGEAGAVVVDLFGSAFGSADLTAMPAVLDFGQVFFGEDRFEDTIITNTGTAFAELRIDSELEAPFSIVGNSCDGGLAAGEECVVTVRFLFDQSTDGLLLLSVARRPVVPAVTGHSAILAIQSDEGQRIEIPLAAISVIPLPDLVSRIESVEQQGFDENGFPVYAIIATVENIGGAFADPGAVGAAFSVEGDGFFAPLLDQEGNIITTGELPDLGGTATVQGFGVIAGAGYPSGTEVQVSVFADACFGREFDQQNCAVPELNEDNNASEPFTTSVPFLTFYPVFDLYNIVDLLQVDIFELEPPDQEVFE